MKCSIFINRSVILLAIISLTHIQFIRAQKMVFSGYSKAQGLSDILVNTILQDEQGFLWIGTWNGFNRYDGYKFKTYKTIEGDTTTLSSDGIKLMADDKFGRIWIICDNGLNYYDKKRDKFVRVCLNNQLTGNYFTGVLADSKGRLWVGTYTEGLWALPVNNATDFSKIKPNFKKYLVNKTENCLTSNYVTGIYEDSQSNIWINASNTIIDLYVPKTDDFRHFPILIPGIKTPPLIITMQYDDNQGNYWMATNDAGLISWDKNKNIFKQYNVENTGALLGSNFISHVRSDKEGILWISTNGGGITFFNTKTKKLDKIVSDPADPNSISSNAVNFTFEDKSGVTWVITYNQGINKLEVNKTKFKLYKQNPFFKASLSHKSITSFTEDDDGNIWIGTDGGGINFFNRKTGEFKAYLHNSQNPNSISTNVVVSLIKDYEGNLWAGTFLGGLNYYDRKQNKFTRFKPDPNNKNTVSDYNIWALCEDHNHNIWIGTIEGTLNLYHRKTKHFYQFKRDLRNPNSFIQAYTTNIFEDSRHYLWIATSNGLEMVKLDDFDFSKTVPELKFTHYSYIPDKNSLSASNVFSIFEDHDSNMWIGTNGAGLNKLNTKTNEFNTFTTKNGFPSNTIKGILEDNEYNLWISTENGLLKFNPHTHATRIFDASDGLQDSYFSKACVKAKDGSLFFGGPSGFNVFKPTDITSNLKPPPIMLTNLRIFNNSVSVGQKIEGNVILNQPINLSKEISLSYKINFFSIEFAALDFTEPNKNKYAYIMEGFDNQWRYTNAANRLATYTNLNPGKYIFRVRGSNNDAVWNNDGISLIINIIPPWWQKWWFRILIIIIIASFVIVLFFIRLALYRKRQKALKHLVRSRTRELEQSNTLLLERQSMIEEQSEELKSTNERLNERQKQIEEQTEKLRVYSDDLKKTNNILLEKQKLIETQAEFMKVTNEKLLVSNTTKDKFFTIIAHDLRNPFHSVIGFSEFLLNNFEKLTEEKVKKYISSINSTSLNGYELLENLLQWSRSHTGRILFEPVQTNIALIVEEVLGLLEGNATAKNIRFQQLIELEVSIVADENMLKIIFRNLISNAIKFTPRNGIITLDLKVNDSFVEISVNDTGVGIPAEYINTLFNVDKSLSTKGTENESGTGLGLVLCKEFVERHNGKIWVESEVGKGSNFIFTLPMRQ